MYSGNYRIVAPFENENVEHAQVGLAFYPGMFVDKPKKVLSMGLGYGISLGAFLKLNPEILDSVEILQSVYEISPKFKSKNHEWYNDVRVNKHVDDARSFLNKSKESYDLISTNIASPYSNAGSFFLTEEYFEKVKSKLSPSGIYSQLVWGAHLVEIYHTFKRVFPHVKAIPGYEETDLILIGSKSPLIRRRNYSDIKDYWRNSKEFTT